MNFQKIFWGIILLLVGILMLFKHLGLIHIHFWNLIHFWPVILIIWGVIVLPIKNNIKVIISIGILGLTLIITAYIADKKPGFFNDRHGIYFHDNGDEWDNPYFDTDSTTTDI